MGLGAGFSLDELMLDELATCAFPLEELELDVFALEELTCDFVLDELTRACFALEETAVEELEIAAELDDCAELTAAELTAMELELGSVFSAVVFACGVSLKRSLPFSSTILLNCLLAIFTIVNLFWIYPPRLTVSFSMPISFARCFVPDKSSTSTKMPSGLAKAAVKAIAMSKKIFFIFYLK